MKNNILNILTWTALACVMFFFSSCGDDNEVSVKEKNAELLSKGVWQISKVEVDNIDKTSDFTGFTLQFTSSTYTASNGEPLWPSQGTWIFKDDAATSLMRGDNIEVSIQTIAESNLVLKMNWDHPTFAPGRKKSIEGEYIFTFKK